MFTHVASYFVVFFCMFQKGTAGSARVHYNVFRCVYCLEVTTKKQDIIDHMEEQHPKQLQGERYGVLGAARRLESLAGPGVRKVSRERCVFHWDTVREVFDSKQRRALRQITRAILAEAEVIIAEEDDKPQSNFMLIKDLYADML